MQVHTCVKPAFVVIGKEGSTRDSEGIVQALWQDANAHFAEVAQLAKREADGTLCGIWGAMSDFSRSFQPWKDFCEGLYLAGIECRSDAEAPDGWTRWELPAYEYRYTACEDSGTFARMLQYLQQNGLPLAGAVQDFTCPQDGKNYLYFPVRRLQDAEVQLSHTALP